MSGTLALVGAGEFLDAMNTVDRALLDRSGGLRVAVLPTASAPDGPGVPERWAKLGIEHFNALGAQTDGVMALDRESCNDQSIADRVSAANLVYFSGGKPDYLYETLVDTSVWAAVKSVYDRGGVIAGCSAGAMIMGAYVPSFKMQLGLPHIVSWQPAFGLVKNSIVVPHYNEFPEFVSRLMFRAPKGTTMIGMDGNTALVGSNNSWLVMGQLRVTLRIEGKTMRYLNGQSVQLN
ncbi:MAG TPA: Type 1 glutamine amidotransferase-like domain-containing protein [Anaerolineae bacterium]|nr:Type 1 glutamine amidotransferase-like domain-containing protein [Anaerolineae bacterium]